MYEYDCWGVSGILQLSSSTNIVGFRYRRGKPESNDVDIVISHPDLKSGAGIVKGLCQKLVNRLYSQGEI
jgi:hypothetical protein